MKLQNWKNKEKMKISAFCALMVEKGVSRPTEIKAEYERRFPNAKPKTLDAYMKACNRQV